MQTCKIILFMVGLLTAGCASSLPEVAAPAANPLQASAPLPFIPDPIRKAPPGNLPLAEVMANSSTHQGLPGITMASFENDPTLGTVTVRPPPQG